MLAHCITRLAFLLLLLTVAATAPDLITLAHQGESISDVQARQTSASLDKTPNAAELHASLLGYDLIRIASTHQSRLENILWMIQNKTEEPIAGSVYCQIDPAEDADGYARGKTVWDALVAAHSSDAKILANAAGYFAVADFSAAEALLQQSISLEPKNAAWPERLAMLYEIRFARHRDDTARLAPAALALRQSAYNLTPDARHRFAILVRMPMDACRAQDLISAKHLASQLINTSSKFKTDPAYGDAVHWGNIALGEIALHENKMDEAEDDLAAAGKTPGSVSLATTGPDFGLARELLSKGERMPVHDYLIACEQFWTAGTVRLKAWIATVDAGGTPDM